MPLVLDASATLSWLLDDERDDLAVATLHAIRRFKAIVPGLWRWEIQNALLVAERRGRIDVEIVNTLLADLDRLPIAVADPSRLALAAAELTFARRYDMSACDAAYLELSFRTGLPLITRDRKLSAAASDLGLLWSPSSARKV